jgi:hypothetical protein
MSVGHAMANDLKSKRKMYEGVGDTNLMQASAAAVQTVWLAIKLYDGLQLLVAYSSAVGCSSKCYLGSMCKGHQPDAGKCRSCSS